MASHEVLATVEFEAPLSVVPLEAAATVADLGIAGRYLPAGQGPAPIAGDFYDVLVLRDDLIALFIGA